MPHQSENVTISIYKQLSKDLYFGPCYKLDSFKPVNQCNNTYLEFRKTRRLEFWISENERRHYSYDDYEDFLEGMDFNDFHQRQLLDRQYDMDQSENYSERCYQEYRNHLYLKHNNFIKLPVYHLETVEDYDDPWKLSFDDLENDDGNDNDHTVPTISDTDTDNESDYDIN